MFLALLSSFALSTSAAGCEAHNDAVNAAADVVEARYVIADEGRVIADQLRAWSRDGRYRQPCDDSAGFMSQLNRDLDGWDGHFFFERQSDSADVAAQDWLSAWRAEARTVNAGVREARVLEGNIGYVRISSWYPWDSAGPKLHAALALVADVDGLIIDLRGNGGGDAATVSHLMRALAPSSIDAVQSIARRDAEQPEPLPEAELPRIRETLPLAILVDRRSASASEYLAYSLQALDRAVVIGGRSGGVASMIGEPVALPNGFAIAVPEARPVNLITRGNWEADGVRPDHSGGDDPVHVARRHLEHSGA
ncbi:S41 family peptidase [Brevundimonas diminuta]|uniref:Peptidase S41 n=1 Tax=Brevundimonas diminuta TaxID=293 RepID=A0A1Z3LVJ7_BREDI|nr:S41 family peptidase [Brevundimonas diminuta]ASD26234.1 peptidase S41 [Brevundimonas diminuta]